jgi:hypothetical protein
MLATSFWRIHPHIGSPPAIPFAKQIISGFAFEF